MFDFGIIYLFNSFFVIVLILWLLTIVGYLFYDKKDNLDRLEFYECGFLKINDLKFSLSIGSINTIIFILLYDLELVFTIPVLFFTSSYSFYITLNVFILFFFIFITVFIDIIEDSILWDCLL